MMGLPVGVFIGNLLYHGLVNNDWGRGFFVGLIAFVITTILVNLFPFLTR